MRSLVVRQTRRLIVYFHIVFDLLTLKLLWSRSGRFQCFAAAPNEAEAIEVEQTEDSSAPREGSHDFSSRAWFAANSLSDGDDGGDGETDGDDVEGDGNRRVNVSEVSLKFFRL